MPTSGWCATGHLPEREILTGIGPVVVRDRSQTIGVAIQVREDATHAGLALLKADSWV